MPLLLLLLMCHLLLLPRLKLDLLPHLLVVNVHIMIFLLLLNHKLLALLFLLLPLLLLRLLLSAYSLLITLHARWSWCWF